MIIRSGAISTLIFMCQKLPPGTPITRASGLDGMMVRVHSATLYPTPRAIASCWASFRSAIGLFIRQKKVDSLNLPRWQSVKEDTIGRTYTSQSYDEWTRELALLYIIALILAGEVTTLSHYTREWPDTLLLISSSGEHMIIRRTQEIINLYKLIILPLHWYLMNSPESVYTFMPALRDIHPYLPYELP